MCVVVEDSQFAVCDDIVELNALPPVCPRRPAPPRQALSVDSTGHTLLSGESIELSIVVSDNCGNVFECRAEPILDPDPADPTRTLLCPPKAARCPVSSRCPL